MDGYAISSKDLPDENIKELNVVGTVFAGKPYMEKLLPGECVRIMTGGIMPKGTDTVVIQENVERHDDIIKIGTDIKLGDNVRQAGEDIKIGDAVLSKGFRLTPADIGLIASLGISEVNVIRKLKVAFFSTGE